MAKFFGFIIILIAVIVFLIGSLFVSTGSDGGIGMIISSLIVGAFGFFITTT